MLPTPLRQIIAMALVAVPWLLDGPVGVAIGVVGVVLSVDNLRRIAAARWPVVTVMHQRCPDTRSGVCPGHRIRLTRAGWDRVNAVRDAGNLAYMGDGPRPPWLARLTESEEGQ
jgi:hypothetical protein